jgi:hypothetical protein
MPTPGPSGGPCTAALLADATAIQWGGVDDLLRATVMAYEILSTCIFIPGFNRAECASWVQAIGALLAIGVTGYIARRQSKQMAAQKVVDDAQRIGEKFAPAIATIEAAMGELKRIYTEAQETREEGRFSPPSTALERVRLYAQVFSTIEVANMPSVDSAKLTLRARQILGESEGVINQSLNELDPRQTAHAATVVGKVFEAHLLELAALLDGLRLELVRITASDT